MNIQKLLLIGIFWTVLTLEGCATINTLDTIHADYPQSKKTSVFREKRFLVFDAAQQVLGELGFTIYYQNSSSGRIYARSKELLPMLGLGEKVGVYVIYLEEDFTKVEVVVQKAFFLNLGYNDWRDKILKKINEYLKILKKL